MPQKKWRRRRLSLGWHDVRDFLLPDLGCFDAKHSLGRADRPRLRMTPFSRLLNLRVSPPVTVLS